MQQTDFLIMRLIYQEKNEVKFQYELSYITKLTICLFTFIPCHMKRCLMNYVSNNNCQSNLGSDLVIHILHLSLTNEDGQ